MPQLSSLSALLVAVPACVFAAWPRAAAEGGPNARTFLATYTATVTGLPPGGAVRVWLPVPPSNAEQTVTPLDHRAFGTARRTREAEYGNDILYVEGAAGANGTAEVATKYRVHRREVRGAQAGPAAMTRFLQPDAKVPVAGKPLTLLAGKDLPRDPTAKARALYDTVLGHMRYSKEGTGWGRGDAVWACDSRYGNCSDFHSLFISLARAQGLPALFEIGFGLPVERGRGEVAGYHCWAKYSPDGKGWVAVDISEASKQPGLRDYYFGGLTADRVAFSTGRDLTLAPRPDGPPLNFFIHPYAEAGGRPHPAEKVAMRFTYEDVDG
jgi:transglutaminase-like putative cysteine protease